MSGENPCEIGKQIVVVLSRVSQFSLWIAMIVGQSRAELCWDKQFSEKMKKRSQTKQREQHAAPSDTDYDVDSTTETTASTTPSTTETTDSTTAATTDSTTTEAERTTAETTSELIMESPTSAFPSYDDDSPAPYTVPSHVKEGSPAPYSVPSYDEDSPAPYSVPSYDEEDSPAPYTVPTSLSAK